MAQRRHPGEHQGGTLQGTDRAPKGWVRAYWVFRPPTHPLQPLQDFRGPLRWWVTSLSSWARYPVLPTRYTLPQYPLAIPVCRAVPHVPQCRGVPWACTYGRFWEPVGEPRGMEHSLFQGPGLVYTVIYGLHGRLTGFMARFNTVLLSLEHVY